MDYNITDIEEAAEDHPYMTGVIILIVLLVLGLLVAFTKTVKNGILCICDCVYYITAPIHMPIRWAYRKL